jgi:hypothetical protein
MVCLGIISSYDPAAYPLIAYVNRLPQVLHVKALQELAATDAGKNKVVRWA